MPIAPMPLSAAVKGTVPQPANGSSTKSVFLRGSHDRRPALHSAQLGVTCHSPSPCRRHGASAHCPIGPLRLGKAPEKTLH